MSDKIIIVYWVAGMALHVAGRILERYRQHPESCWFDYFSFFLRADFVISNLLSLVLLTLWLSGSGEEYISDKIPMNWATAMLLGYLSDSLSKHLIIPFGLSKVANGNGK